MPGGKARSLQQRACQSNGVNAARRPGVTGDRGNPAKAVGNAQASALGGCLAPGEEHARWEAGGMVGRALRFATALAVCDSGRAVGDGRTSSAPERERPPERDAVQFETAGLTRRSGPAHSRRRRCSGFPGRWTDSDCGLMPRAPEQLARGLLQFHRMVARAPPPALVLVLDRDARAADRLSSALEMRGLTVRGLSCAEDLPLDGESPGLVVIGVRSDAAGEVDWAERQRSLGYSMPMLLITSAGSAALRHRVRALGRSEVVDDGLDCDALVCLALTVMFAAGPGR
jgi:hypothetical protein